MKFYQILQEIMTQQKLSIAQLSAKCGIPDSTLRSIIARKSDKVALDIAFKLSNGLGISLEYLNGDTNLEATEDSYSFPIIGDVAAGYDCPAIEEYTGEYEHIPAAWLRGRSRDDFFVLRVKGDSMYPDYQDGDRVLVQRQDIVESGAIAVVIYDSENATLKKVKYYREKNYMELIPLNREYAPKRIEKADLNQCRILGEVRRLIRVVKREE